MSTPATHQTGPRGLRGFAVPGNASKYGKRAHALGLAHQWTREEARAAAAKAVQKRRALAKA